MRTAKRLLNWPGQLHRASNATGRAAPRTLTPRSAPSTLYKAVGGTLRQPRRVSVHRRCPLVQW
jgi:hypothetical protein